jgi:Zn/Cd-binding protein ZinT
MFSFKKNHSLYAVTPLNFFLSIYPANIPFFVDFYMKKTPYIAYLKFKIKLMKKLIYLVFTFVLFSLVSCTKDDGPSGSQPEDSVTLMKKYEIKSGIVHFNVESNLGITYSYVVYFDEYGAKEAKYQYDDMNVLTDIVMQKADGWFYQVSPKYGGGIKTRSTYANGTEGRFVFEWAQQEIEKYNYVLLSDTMICGNTCKKYSFTSSETLSGVNAGCKGITLYSKAIMTMGIYVVSVSSAYAFEENAAIPDSIWNLPANIPIEARE